MLIEDHRLLVPIPSDVRHMFSLLLKVNIAKPFAIVDKRQEPILFSLKSCEQ